MNKQKNKQKNIIFDLGGVLLGLDGERCMQAFDALGCERVSEYVRLHLTTDLFYDIEVGRISTAEFCAEVRRIAGCTASDADIVAAWNALLTEVSDARCAKLRELHGQGYRLFLLSNTNDMHWQRTLQLAPRAMALFTDVFLSYKMHLSKPDVRIFQEVLRQAQLNPAETLFIDDNADNCSAAASLGITTYQNHHINDWLHEDSLF